jgi:hypothetical protein
MALTQSGRPQRSSASLLVSALLLCAGLAFWLDLGSLHRYHHGDSIIPVLVSLQDWTPFYWGQNRIGMLFPLLAAPVSDPLLNLLVQDGMAIFCGLATMWLLPRYVLRDATWPIVGAINVAVLLGATPREHQFEFLIDQPFGPSFAMAVGGLLLLEKARSQPVPWPRVFLGVALLIIGHWLNLAIALVLLPLVVARSLLLPPGMLSEGHSEHAEGDVSLELVSIGTAWFWGFVLMQVVGPPSTSTGIAPASGWLIGWIRLATNTWRAVDSERFHVVLGLLFSASAAALVVPALRRQAGVPVRAAVTLGTAALVYGAFVGTLEWVRMNQFHYRYVMPSLVLAQTALAILAVAPVARVVGLPARAPLRVAALCLPLLAAGWVHGLPSLPGVRQQLDGRFGSRTAEVIAAGSTHVMGQYWTVWPAVFHANLVLHEQGRKRRVWGITDRSGPTQRLWKTIPRSRWRVAVPIGDPDFDKHVEQYGLEALRLEERLSTISVFEWSPGKSAARGRRGRSREPSPTPP